MSGYGTDQCCSVSSPHTDLHLHYQTVLLGRETEECSRFTSQSSLVQTLASWPCNAVEFSKEVLDSLLLSDSVTV